MKKKVLLVQHNSNDNYGVKKSSELLECEFTFCDTSIIDVKSLLEIDSFDLVLLDIRQDNLKSQLVLSLYLKTVLKVYFICIVSHYDKQVLFTDTEFQPSMYLFRPFQTINFVTAVKLAFLQKRLDQSFHVEKSDDKQTISLLRIEKVLVYINSHIHERIDIDTLVTLSQWHKQHFIRVFYKTLKVTPYRYVLNLKIEKICEKLISTDSLCNDIAFECGFVSYPNFFKAFKKNKGCSPQEYRMKFKSRKPIC